MAKQVQYINEPPIIEGFENEAVFELPMTIHSTPSGISNWISIFESPEITDTEGDGIIIELQEEVENIQIVSSDTTFVL